MPSGQSLARSRGSWNGGSSVIVVRDTTDRAGGTLTFTASAWQAFTAAIK